ncbi:hypothetical protein [Polynucleobacter rarus]|uniref:hypothetical protein n=1 Tax=Polynucleobacter rarus TaxID=556055 RepID=UPI000D3E7F32|nr:hypothetical protein [Polynucleobacter rarus]
MALEQKSPASSSTTSHQMHTKAAEHCDAASKAHKEAAKQHESGDAKQAGNHAAVAHAHTLQANDQSEMVIKNMAHPVTSSKK